VLAAAAAHHRVADASFATIDLLDEVRPWVTTITRLRLEAALHKPLPPRRPGTVGRPPVVGKRLPSLKQRLAS
jgi:DDE superfamily endonuclease